MQCQLHSVCISLFAEKVDLDLQIWTWTYRLLKRQRLGGHVVNVVTRLVAAAGGNPCRE